MTTPDALGYYSKKGMPKALDPVIDSFYTTRTGEDIRAASSGNSAVRNW
jgi:hypothetical protein